MFGCGLGLAWLRQSQTCSHLLCRGAALRVLPHLRLCRSHAADSITDNTGRIRPEPVRTRRTEYVRAVFYVGLGEAQSIHYIDFMSTTKIAELVTVTSRSCCQYKLTNL